MPWNSQKRKDKIRTILTKQIHFIHNNCSAARETLDSCIRYHVNGYHLKQYMKERKQWDEHIWNQVDFGLFGRHARALSPSQRVLHMKMVHGQLPLGVRGHQRSLSKDETLKRCPCCGAPTETNSHFWHCAGNTVLKPGLNAFRRDPSATRNPLRRILADGISHWMTTGDSNFSVDCQQYPAHMRDSIRHIIQEQCNIGLAKCSPRLTQQVMDRLSLSLLRY